MTYGLRGADVAARALVAGGVKRLFTLSGNQIMPVFDACIDAGIELLHVRHEAAAVHMADAWGRLKGSPGVAMVTAGPGLANAISAMYVARMAESPLVLISGHAAGAQLGHGAFQEVAQAEMARPVAKASWTVSDASHVGLDLTRAMALAVSGRPGPVHVSVPVDFLESRPVEADVSKIDRGGGGFPTGLCKGAADDLLDVLAGAKRPLILAGPAAARGNPFKALESLSRHTGVPLVPMESPRGTNDPSLGAIAEVLEKADLVMLFAKKLDFSLRFGESPAFSPDCRFVQVDPEAEVIALTRRVLCDDAKLPAAHVAETAPAARQLAELAASRAWASNGWSDEVEAAVSYRPSEWAAVRSSGRPIHPAEAGRAVQRVVDSNEGAVFVSDGGEFGQWAQACVSAKRRLINGPSGAIGSGIPFALAARMVFPDAPVVATLGDGTFGFHAMEFDTAVRYRLPFVAVVGNDAAWNAEYQIQLRDYGPDRLVGCELLPSRYDKVVSALGGHGEQVTEAADLAPALDRALASGLPACVNVMIGREAAPSIRRQGG